MQKMSLWMAALVLALLLALGVGVAASRRAGRLDTAHDSLTAALRVAHQASEDALELRRRAQIAEASRDSLVGVAQQLTRVSLQTRYRYRVAERAAPRDCAPALALADSALAASDSINDALRGALQKAQDASGNYRLAVDTLLPAVRQLGAAAVAVDRARRPGLLERLLPRVGVGLAAGYDPVMHRPATVIGITLGWRF